MSDILEEALTDAKDEKKIMIFRKAFPAVIIGTIIIAIGMTFFNWYSNRIENHNREVGDLFVDIVSDNNQEADLINDALDNFIKDSDNRQIELAEIQKVSNLIESGDKNSAFTRLESIIANSSYHDITTSFARLLWLNLVLDEKNITDEHKMKARNYMQYFNDENQIFFATATLLKALFYQQSNQHELATKYATNILNMNNASLIAKEQARAILAHINYGTSTKK